MKTKENEISKKEQARQAGLKSMKCLTDLNSRLANLEGKKQEIGSQMAGIDTILAGASEERRTAIRGLALGEITQDQFAEVRKKHERASQAKTDASDMVEALEEEISNVAQKIAGQTAEVRDIERFYWVCAMEDLILQAKENAALIYKAFCAYRLAGPAHLNYGDFVAERIFPEMRSLVNNPTYERLQEELLAEYAGK